MRRFEFVHNGSTNFWEIAISGLTLTVRFGKIGTAGQTRNKKLASADVAKREEGKLIVEKTKKAELLVMRQPTFRGGMLSR